MLCCGLYVPNEPQTVVSAITLNIPLRGIASVPSRQKKARTSHQVRAKGRCHATTGRKMAPGPRTGLACRSFHPHRPGTPRLRLLERPGVDKPTAAKRSQTYNHHDCAHSLWSALPGTQVAAQAGRMRDGPRLLLPSGGGLRSRSAVRLRREPGKNCRWQLLCVAPLTAVRLSDRRCRLPCAVETRSGPSDAGLGCAVFQGSRPLPRTRIWWTWAESNRRPAHIYVNFQGFRPHDHFTAGRRKPR